MLGIYAGEFLTCILDMAGLYIIIDRLLHERQELKKALWIIPFVMAEAAVSWFFKLPDANIVRLALVLIGMRLTFSCSMIKIFLAIVIQLASKIGFELLCFQFSQELDTGVPADQLPPETLRHYQAIVAICSLTLLIFIVFLFNHMRLYRIRAFIEKHSISIITAALIAGTALSFMLVVYILEYLTTSLIVYIGVLVNNILLALLLCVSLVRQRSEREQRIQLLENQKNLYELYDAMRSFRHQYINNLIAIKGYAEKGESERINDFSEELLSEYDNALHISNTFDIVKVSDNGLRALIIQKIYSANRFGVRFNFFSDEIRDYIFTPKDLFDIVSILCDNAVQAAAQADGGCVELMLHGVENGFELKIANTFAGEADISKMFEKNYTTKADGEGLGLYHLKSRLLPRYRGLAEISASAEGQTMLVEVGIRVK